MKKLSPSSIINIFFVSIATMVIIFAVVWGALKLKYELKYQNDVIEFSNIYSLDENLIYGIIYAESSFNTEAISSAGAVGLMQILPSTAVWIAEQLEIKNFDVTQLNNPKLNIEMGCFYLRYLFDKFEDESIVLFCYNAGEGEYLENIRNGSVNSDILNNYKSVKKYIDKVQTAKKYYRILY